MWAFVDKSRFQDKNCMALSASVSQTERSVVQNWIFDYSSLQRSSLHPGIPCWLQDQADCKIRTGGSQALSIPTFPVPKSWTFWSSRLGLACVLEHSRHVLLVFQNPVPPGVSSAITSSCDELLSGTHWVCHILLVPVHPTLALGLSDSPPSDSGSQLQMPFPLHAPCVSRHSTWSVSEASAAMSCLSDQPPSDPMGSDDLWLSWLKCLCI